MRCATMLTVQFTFKSEPDGEKVAITRVNVKCKTDNALLAVEQAARAVNLLGLDGTTIKGISVGEMYD